MSSLIEKFVFVCLFSRFYANNFFSMFLKDSQPQGQVQPKINETLVVTKDNI